MIARINKSKTLTKHISCKCKFDGRKYSSNQKWNKDKQGLIQAKNVSGYRFWAGEFLRPNSIFLNFSVLTEMVGNENFN